METNKTPEKRIERLEEQARMRQTAQRFDLSDLFQRVWSDPEPFTVFLSADALRHLRMIWGE